MQRSAKASQTNKKIPINYVAPTLPMAIELPSLIGD